MNILCFGDSNTYGYDPRNYFGGRYDKPWPRILEDKTNWNIQNIGENGREIPKAPVKFTEETDLLIIMLGTNDLLQGNSADAAAKRMDAFLKDIPLQKSTILLIAPPSMELGDWVPSQRLVEASKELSPAYQALAQRLGVRFVDAGEWNIPLAFDGVHFTEAGHRVFAEKLYQCLITEE